MNAEEILKLLSLAGDVYLHARKGYEATRELAKKAGVSDADLAAADARFATVYADPLKEE